MKRSVLILLLSFFAGCIYAQQIDSVKMNALGLKLDEYYDAMKYESIEVQQAECDFLIETVTDSLLRQFVAEDMFRYYLDSPVMGAENVAVYVYDKWFASGKVKMKNDVDFYAAKVFADFNRESLIGKKAPELTMFTPQGEQVTLFGPESKDDKYRVLYFYDTDCAQCKVQTILLRNLLGVKNYPIGVYGIYSGDDHEQWENYMKDWLKVPSAVHLWDPELDSDFQRKYGLIQTPRIFLVGPDGVIVGRGLDVDALQILLDAVFDEKKLEYGGTEGEMLFDNIFSISDGRPSPEEVKGIADYISDKTLVAGDTLMFRQLSGDYLYYLSSHPGEGFKEGMKYHISKNILVDNGVWTSADDSLKVIGYAKIMADLLSKAEVGSKICSVKVPCEVMTSRGEKKRNVRLDRLKKAENVIIFYTDGCDVCAQEKETARKLFDSSRKVSVIMVNMDDIIAENPGLSHRLMDCFDLSSLPYITITNSRGTIMRRYVSLMTDL